MDGDAQNTKLLEVVNHPKIGNMADVIRAIQDIDDCLQNDDGLKWFNLLYLKVSQAVSAKGDAPGWADPAWVRHLDVVFVQLYFEAISNFVNGGAVPSSWDALFESRHAPGIDRIQFALAGMNAHINHDLALALLQTDDDLGLKPARNSPEHGDFESVNEIIESVLPSALRILATGILGELAQDTGKIGRLLAIWNVRVARDLAWDFADHLRGLSGLGRQLAVNVQDKVTGALGRSLLIIA